MSSEKLLSTRAFAEKFGFLLGPNEQPSAYAVAGLMCYPPNGARLKAGIEDSFRRTMDQHGFHPVNVPAISAQEEWEASGHLAKFPDMFATTTPDERRLILRPEIATQLYPLMERFGLFLGSRLPLKFYSTGEVFLAEQPNSCQWQTYTRSYTTHEGHLLLSSQGLDVEKTVDYMASLAVELMEAGGLLSKDLVFRKKNESEKPFYTSDAWGLFCDSLEGLELMGVQYRGNRDFSCHDRSTHTKTLINGQTPEVFEISWSTDRPFLALLNTALTTLESRQVLRLPEHLVPSQAVILPIQQPTDKIIENTKILEEILHSHGISAPTDNFGRMTTRYSRADASGVPFCFVVDNRSDSFALRERDTAVQVRVTRDDILEIISQARYGTTPLQIIRTLYTLGMSK